MKRKELRRVIVSTITVEVGDGKTHFFTAVAATISNDLYILRFLELKEDGSCIKYAVPMKDIESFRESERYEIEQMVCINCKEDK